VRVVAGQASSWEIARTGFAIARRDDSRRVYAPPWREGTRSLHCGQGVEVRPEPARLGEALSGAGGAVGVD